MKKSLARQFEEQFGKEWACSCKAAFDPKALEIISENKSSLIAHYVCPNCQKEQMLAAAVRTGDREETTNLHLPRRTISADDVLDIKEELKVFKTAAIRALDRRASGAKVNSVQTSNRSAQES